MELANWNGCNSHLQKRWICFLREKIASKSLKLTLSNCNQVYERRLFPPRSAIECLESYFMRKVIFIVPHLLCNGADKLFCSSCQRKGLMRPLSWIKNPRIVIDIDDVYYVDTFRYECACGKTTSGFDEDIFQDTDYVPMIVCRKKRVLTRQLQAVIREFWRPMTATAIGSKCQSLIFQSFLQRYKIFMKAFCSGDFKAFCDETKNRSTGTLAECLKRNVTKLKQEDNSALVFVPRTHGLSLLPSFRTKTRDMLKSRGIDSLEKLVELKDLSGEEYVEYGFGNARDLTSSNHRSRPKEQAEYWISKAEEILINSNKVRLEGATRITMRQC